MEDSRVDPVAVRSFPRPINDIGGKEYSARICARATDRGSWEAWVEFTAEDGTVFRSTRETTQPNFRNLEWWAARLSGVFLEGSLHRALERQGSRFRSRAQDAPPLAVFEGPAPSLHQEKTLRPDDSPVNPILLRAQGEDVLRSRLEALPASELRLVVRAYGLVGTRGVDVDALSAGALVELIVSAVQGRGDVSGSGRT